MGVRRMLMMAAMGVVMVPASRMAWGWMYVPLDLDSLAAKSEVAVEGEVMGGKGILDVKVMEVYAGGVKAGDELRVNPLFYAKAGQGAARTAPFAVGDRLFWFLVKSKDKEPGGVTGWEPLEGGVKLEAGGRVVEFTQAMNPGPVVAETTGMNRHGAEAPLVEAYREEVAGSFKTVARFKQEMAAAVAAKDADGLVELLVERARVARKEGTARDELADQAGAALVPLHNNEALDAALNVEGVWSTEEIARGFWTEEGMAYLFKRIEDGALSAKQRDVYVRALPPGMVDVEGGPVMWPKGSLVRLAKLAAEAQRKGDDSLAGDLLNPVRLSAGHVRSLGFVEQGDLAEAVKVVKGMREKGGSEGTLWQMDEIVRAGGSGGPMGPVKE
ncbi:MAG TPA: hypothetical protein VH253_01115 [Phycisphaerae bacterium]|nr:hypothetical protein [Phycisphaerae bacterium]